MLDSPHAFVSCWEREVQWSEAQWRQRLVAADWLVAMESGAVIGIAATSGEPCEGRHVESIWVAPTHRRRGVFRALLDTIVEVERGNGGRDLALWVLEHNPLALTAYLRLGFVPTGERQRLPDGQYELRLRLEITPTLGR